MIIRKALEGDLPGLLQLYAQQDINNGDVLHINEAKDIFATMKSYPDYHVYVAEEVGEIVGTLALAILHNLAHQGSRSGSMEDVVVEQAHQGKGIGKQMRAFAMEVCKEKACYKVCLSSRLKRSGAHGFYKASDSKSMATAF